MIIWSGWGGIVAVIAFGCCFLAEVMTRSLYHDEAYYDVHGWPKLAALWTAAALVYLIALWLGREPGRVMIDKATGEEVVLRKNHTLFFVPVRYWPYLLLGFGVLFLFIDGV